MTMMGKYFLGNSLNGRALDSTSDDGNSTTCTDGVQWIWNTFGQCVEDPVEYAAFIIGFISFILWLFPCLPQIYQNYKRGNCDEALSIYFLMFWFFGDTLNLSGAILSNQLPIQIYIGVYYIFQDCVILGQYCYYKFKNRWRNRLINELGPPVLSCIIMYSVVSTFCADYQIKFYNGKSGVLSNSDFESEPTSFQSRRLLTKPFFDGYKAEVGYIFGTVSAFSYLCGRLPQLYKNFCRKSTEGVSLLMFTIIITANFTYGLSVLLAGEGVQYFLLHLPWLIGSFGCCLCDVFVVVQHFKYKNRLDDDRRLIIDDKDDVSESGYRDHQ